MLTKGSPQSIVGKLNAELVKASQQADIKEHYTGISGTEASSFQSWP